MPVDFRPVVIPALRFLLVVLPLIMRLRFQFPGQPLAQPGLVVLVAVFLLQVPVVDLLLAHWPLMYPASFPVCR